jgi:two-component system sensor histidine kinase ResE
LVEDLLELSRLQSGSTVLEKEWVNITEMLLEIKDKFQTSFKQNGIDFAVTVDPNAVSVWADRFRLEQVLINLIDNSIRYTQRGKITITTRESDKGIELIISDTGQGISEEDLPYIFERFYRADKSRNRESGGTGLGLAIAKNIIDAHHGKISVTSIKGVGTTFIIELPKESAHREASKQQ